ncbi:leucine-rich repeat-containing protein 51-like [Pollicipes pollicipes]|uniref:leucine-rich repeat-containing protein 51-like n=1 Tax=Pollicipes pollicipes TaxID=41117 RepID=UPI001884B5D7|nr:leucine-rich repeat-containing protein 51-like [Pollicipes pollicipes]
MTDARLWLENRRMSVNPFEWLEPLRVLYFHANQLASLQEVAKLTMLPYLRALTLHGNPLEEGTPRYRTRVLLLLAWASLGSDFSAVTRRDRAIAQFNMLPKPRPRRIKDDDDDAAV